MKKQILVILTLTIIAVLFIPVTVAAQNTTINGAEVHMGDKIIYELSIDDASDIAAGLQLEIYFNDSILKVVNADCHNLENSVLNPNKYGNGKIMLNASSINGYDFIDGNKLLTVEFEVIGSGHTKIIEDFICFYDIHYDDLEFSFSHILKKNNVILIEKELETTVPSTTVVPTTQKTTATVPTTLTSTTTLPIVTTSTIPTRADITTEVATTVTVTAPVTSSVVVTDATEPTTAPITITVPETTSVATTVGSSDQIVSEPNTTEIIIIEPTENTTVIALPTEQTENTTEYITDNIPVCSTFVETTDVATSTDICESYTDASGTTSDEKQDMSGIDIVYTGEISKATFMVFGVVTVVAIIILLFFMIKKIKNKVDKI